MKEESFFNNEPKKIFYFYSNEYLKYWYKKFVQIKKDKKMKYDKNVRR